MSMLLCQRGLTLFVALAAVAAAGEKPEWLGRIRRDHPRMFFNAETWPQVKARAEGSARAARDALVQRCDRYPADPVCTGFDPVVFREVKTASGTHKTTAATPIPSARMNGTVIGPVVAPPESNATPTNGAGAKAARRKSAA